MTHACSNKRDARHQDGRIARLLNGLGLLDQTDKTRRRRQVGPGIFLQVVDGCGAQGEAGDFEVHAVGRPAPGSSPTVDDVIVGDFLGQGRFGRAGNDRPPVAAQSHQDFFIQPGVLHRLGEPASRSALDSQVRLQFVVAGAQNRRGAGRADEQRHAIRLLVIQGAQDAVSRTVARFALSEAFACTPICTFPFQPFSTKYRYVS